MLRGVVCTCMLWAAACGPGKADTATDSDSTQPQGTCMGNLSCSLPGETSSSSSSTCEADGCGAPTTCGADGCGGATTCAGSGCGGETTCAGSGCGDVTTEAPPTNCAPGAGDLAVVWERSDGAAQRGEAVAAGASRVAWLAGGFDGARLEVLDGDGAALWEASVGLMLGEAELTFKDVAIFADGGVVVAGTTPMFEGLVAWFDFGGSPLGEDVAAMTEWTAVALPGDGSVVVAGSQDSDVRVSSFPAIGPPGWSQLFGDMGAAWSFDVIADAGRVVVSGHSNESPGPVLAVYDDVGALQWSVVDPGGPLELGTGVTSDATGRLYQAITTDDQTGRVDLYEPDGAFIESFALEYGPRAIGVDADQRLVIAGARPLGETTVVVERRSAAGELVSSRSREGWRALGLAVDADCRAYVVGDAPAGAWLEKLN